MSAAVAEASAALAASSDEALLTAIMALTHRIHEAHRAPVTAARTRGDYEDDLRAQRDAVRAEVLRRMGGHQ